MTKNAIQPYSRFTYCTLETGFSFINFAPDIFFKSLNRMTMASLKKSLTAKILPKKPAAQTRPILDMIRQYSKAADIIERTRLAMGKKNSLKKTVSSSTRNQKLNTSAYGTTH